MPPHERKKAPGGESWIEAAAALRDRLAGRARTRTQARDLVSPVVRRIPSSWSRSGTRVGRLLRGGFGTGGSTAGPPPRCARIRGQPVLARAPCRVPRSLGASSAARRQSVRDPSFGSCLGGFGVEGSEDSRGPRLVAPW